MPELKFTKSTDEEHEIKLDSTLIYANWRQGSAWGGYPAKLEVGTSFVGNGGKIKITGKSESGKNLGKLSDVINSNTFIGELEIPDDLEPGEEIFFKVELSKNGLSGGSNRIPVFPPPEVTNMQWSANEARRGDTLTLSADVNRVRDETEVIVTIYEHDQDGAHDRITELPAIVKNKRIEVLWEYEYHEDSDEIPTEEEMQEYGGSYNPPEYFFTFKFGDLEIGREQESGLLVFKDWIQIELVDNFGHPIGERDYEIHLPDGTTREGTLDEEGKVRIEDIPPGKIRIVYPGLFPEFEQTELSTRDLAPSGEHCEDDIGTDEDDEDTEGDDAPLVDIEE